MDDEERNCSVCGRPVMYGDRHSRCGAAVMAAVAEEREACAVMLDEKADDWDDPAEAFGLRLGAAEIRARSNLNSTNSSDNAS